MEEPKAHGRGGYIMGNLTNEFIKKIIVHAPEKVDGKRVQKVDIVFNFVGEINFLSAIFPPNLL